MKIGNREFDTDNDIYIMGILNVTPDSFSDGGRFVSKHGSGVVISEVLRVCDSMIADGADIIDVGGESTRPGAPTVSANEELERVIPVIEEIAKRFDVAISVDTYKAEVALEAARAGAHIINDIWGLKGDEKMADTVASIMKAYDGTALCLMHNRRPVKDNNSENEDLSVPITMHGEEIDYGYRRSGDGDLTLDEELFVADVKSDIAQCVDIALKAGVPKERIIIDPGVGFAKTYKQNLITIKRISDFGYIDYPSSGYRYPTLLGTSRKSVIGTALDREVHERLYGTTATTSYAYLNGVSFVRVHDVKANSDVIRMLKAIREDSNG